MYLKLGAKFGKTRKKLSSNIINLFFQSLLSNGIVECPHEELSILMEKHG